jgi:protein neuralized
MNCGFNNCLKENVMVNCIFCRKLNIFENNIQINGQTIKCGYCKNTFNEILCPYCREINAFPLADFCFGKLYKCQYLTCMKEFQFLICPKCLIYTYTNDKAEGKKFKCDKCQINFINFGCPFCKSNIIIKSSSFKIGQMIKCPSKNCGKIYCFISCSRCQKLIFSKENEIFYGKAVRCPHLGCKSYTVSIICPMCQVNTIFAGERNSFNEGDNIVCKKCNNNYIFHINNSIYSGEIFALDKIEGKTLDFGVGEIDENYLAVQKLFFDFNKNQYSQNKSVVVQDENNSNNDTYSRPLKECIICHNNIKESIFYPCGHRCTCYNCAVIVFTVNKKCPRCNKEASCIIKKVYE